MTTAYTYDNNDRLTQTGGTTYTYDANGSTLTETLDGNVTTYTYNAKNQLTSVAKPDNGSTKNLSYTYDIQGIRITNTVNGATTNYLVDHNQDYSQVIQESDAASSVIYTYADDLIAQDRAGVVSTYHYDGLGSTRALSAVNAMISDTYNFDAFGITLNQTGSTANNYLFAGEQRDSDLELDYLRARYLDFSVGRFTQMDTWVGVNSDPITLNKYVYGNSDPAMYVDPTGNSAMTLGGQLTALNGLAILVGAATANYSDAIVGAVAVVFDIANNFAENLWAMAEATSVPNINNENDRVAYEANRREYKNRCDEQRPPGGTQCDKWRWDLQKHKDCADMREEFSFRWYNGADEGHQIAVDEKRKAIEKLEKKIERACK